MSMIKKIQDERLRNLATTLKESGVAASETEAIRMAEGMINIESKMGGKLKDAQDKALAKKPSQDTKQEPSQTTPHSSFEQKSQQKQSDVEIEEEIPGTIENLSQNLVRSSNEYISNLTVEQAVGLADVEPDNNEPNQEVSEREESDEPQTTQETQEETKQEETTQVIEETKEITETHQSIQETTSHEDSEEDFINDVDEPEKTNADEPQEPKEENYNSGEEESKSDEDKPKRDLSEFRESEVDLGNVFKYKG